MVSFFQKQYFELLDKYGNEIRDKSDQEQNEAYEILQQANDLTKNWAEALITQRFEQGHLGGFTNRPTNQGNKFKHYTWAKIYPRKNAPKKLAFTVGIDAYVGFIVKIDTVGDIGIKRNKYELLRGDFDDDSPIIAFLPIDDGLSKNLDELVAWSVEEIQKFGITYDNLCAELELDDENDASDFTAQLALNFLKNRYVKSEQKTKKIFLCINNLGKELALETGNLSTTTVRVFIQEQPPENIIEAGQCKFIPRNAEKQSPNSNLNTNTTTLRSEDDFYQISPKSKVELLQLCNWLDEIGNNLAMVNLDNKSKGSTKVDKSLNRILFGAAGTGKTFHSINHALSIIENKPLEVLEEEDRTVLKTRFDQYKEQGQIKFVTFHQSFSYEDFVEGIRAESQKDESGKSEITYPIASGVFKSICLLASEGEFDSTTSNYEELINIVVDNLLNKLKNDELVVLQTKTGKKFSLHQGSGDKNIVYRTTSGYSNSISIGSVKKQLMLELEERKTHPVYEPKLVEALQEDIKKIMRKQNPLKLPYVLIIDEINRGNISRIFGELITLIEDSKRQGAEEELSVTLPYSKEEFSVPSNVYIIGTMNSSDRSLTGLDIALRRRFIFVEMPPKPEEIKNKDGELIKLSGKDKNGNDKEVIIADILSVMNQRIEVLLDRDHCIGHANFLSLKKQPTLEHLAVIFKQKIIPQLQEYFFDDWSKINMVLNANGMLKAQTVERSVLFPNVNTESEGIFEDQKTWQIVETAFDSIDSFAKIIRH